MFLIVAVLCLLFLFPLYMFIVSTKHQGKFLVSEKLLGNKPYSTLFIKILLTIEPKPLNKMISNQQCKMITQYLTFTKRMS